MGFLSRKEILNSSAFLVISLLALFFLIFPPQAQARIPPEFQTQAISGPPFSLSSGWNEIVWSDAAGFTGQTVLESIDSYCGAGTGLAIAQKPGDFWEEYVAGYGGRHFVLTNAGYYYLNLSRQYTWDPTVTPPSRYYGYVTFTNLSDPGLPIENLGTYTRFFKLIVAIILAPETIILQRLIFRESERTF